jgi:hypothetical protein
MRIGSDGRTRESNASGPLALEVHTPAPADRGSRCPSVENVMTHVLALQRFTANIADFSCGQISISSITPWEIPNNN